MVRMAQKQIVQMIDDYDGTEADDVKTRYFGVDGVQYEVDLTDANFQSLREALATYIGNARRLSSRGKPIYRTIVEADPRTVRQWAVDNGYQVPARGRIPGEVREAFEAAQR